MTEKPKDKSAVEFAVPYSLQESIYRILETKGRISDYFVPSVEKLTSDRYHFHLQSLRMRVTYRKFFSRTVVPVIQVEGFLQSLDETSTLVTAHVSIHWIAIVMGVAISFIFLNVFWPYIPVAAMLILNVGLILIWSYVSRQLYNDYHHLKSLLYEAMSE